MLRYPAVAGQRRVAAAFPPGDGVPGVGQLHLAHISFAEESRGASERHQLGGRPVRGQRLARVDAGFFICNSDRAYETSVIARRYI